jgi:parvulin-like peptidyl-prolyl isomerase
VRQAYGREFFNTIFELEENEVSGIVNSNLGYHVIKVTEYQEARLLQLDDTIGPDSSVTVRQYIRQNLYQQKQQQVLQRALQEVTEELKSQAEIQRYDS